MAGGSCCGVAGLLEKFLDGTWSSSLQMEGLCRVLSGKALAFRFEVLTTYHGGGVVAYSVELAFGVVAARGGVICGDWDSCRGG
jgi:hypothetical protein